MSRPIRSLVLTLLLLPSVHVEADAVCSHGDFHILYVGESTLVYDENPSTTICGHLYNPFRRDIDCNPVPNSEDTYEQYWANGAWTKLGPAPLYLGIEHSGTDATWGPGSNGACNLYSIRETASSQPWWGWFDNPGQSVGAHARMLRIVRTAAWMSPCTCP